MNWSDYNTGKVRFSPANRKLEKLNKALGGAKAFSFDLLAGWACPNALECKSFAIMDETGRVTVRDGENIRYRCYSASDEARYKGTYAFRARNFATIRAAVTAEEIVRLLEEAFPKKANIVRIHVSGDFFKINYFKAWLQVIQNHPDVRFYCYTKMVKLVLEHQAEIPTNLTINFSIGGSEDNLIPDGCCFSRSFVVESMENTSLPENDDDYLALVAKGDFALPIHGTQPKRIKS